MMLGLQIITGINGVCLTGIALKYGTNHYVVPDKDILFHGINNFNRIHIKSFLMMSNIPFSNTMALVNKDVSKSPPLLQIKVH